MKFTGGWEMVGIVADIICYMPNFQSFLIYSTSHNLLHLQCPNVCCIANILTSAPYPKFIPLQTPSSLLIEKFIFPANDRYTWTSERKIFHVSGPGHGL